MTYFADDLNRYAQAVKRHLRIAGHQVGSFSLLPTSDCSRLQCSCGERFDLELRLTPLWGNIGRALREHEESFASQLIGGVFDGELGLLFPSSRRLQNPLQCRLRDSNTSTYRVFESGYFNLETGESLWSQGRGYLVRGTTTWEWLNQADFERRYELLNAPRLPEPMLSPDVVSFVDEVRTHQGQEGHALLARRNWDAESIAFTCTCGDTMVLELRHIRALRPGSLLRRALDHAERLSAFPYALARGIFDAELQALRLPDEPPPESQTLPVVRKSRFDRDDVL